jgi:hypothetical protein
MNNGGDREQARARKLLADRWTGKITPEIADAFKAIGWEFAGQVYAILKCSACRDKPNRPDSEFENEKRKLVAEHLGDDEDGIASSLAGD